MKTLSSVLKAALAGVALCVVPIAACAQNDSRNAPGSNGAISVYDGLIRITLDRVVSQEVVDGTTRIVGHAARDEGTRLECLIGVMRGLRGGRQEAAAMFTNLSSLFAEDPLEGRHRLIASRSFDESDDGVLRRYWERQHASSPNGLVVSGTSQTVFAKDGELFSVSKECFLRPDLPSTTSQADASSRFRELWERAEVRVANEGLISTR